MSLLDIKEAKEIKACFHKLGGREGISKRAIAICERIASSKSQREAVFAIGRMARLYQLCRADSYWGEKSSMGRTAEHYAILQAAEHEGDFSKAIDAGPDLN